MFFTKVYMLIVVFLKYNLPYFQM